jgi:phytoene synthase
MRERSAPLAYITALLGSRERSGVRALFAFVSICKDAIDLAGSRTEAQASVALLTRLLEEGVIQRYADDHSIVDEVIDAVPDFALAWEAWSYLEEDFEIPRAYAIEFARGLKQDADGYRPETVEDLLRYVYRTGGVLGLIACHLFSVAESVQQSAVDAASAARLISLADNVYQDFTLGRCFVPLAWMSYATNQTFAPTWAAEASRRFRKLAAALESASNAGLATLPLRNRAAIAVLFVLHRESRTRITLKVDRVADVVIRHSAGALWKALVPAVRLVARRARLFGYALADAVEQRSIKPIFSLNRKSSAADVADAPVEIRTLPVRDAATALRNQNLLIGREASH